MEDDLFAALERAVKEDRSLSKDLNVKTIFSSWSNQRGYPVLIVSREYQFKTATLSQERNIYPGIQSNNTPIWYIPYNYVTSRNPILPTTAPFAWLQEASKTVTISSEPGWNDWVLFNVQQTGYYRVLYDATNWALLSQQLVNNHSIIHPRSRSQLIDDLYDFVCSGRVTANIFLTLVSYMKKETEYVAWLPAVRAFQGLDRMLPEIEEYEKYRTWVAELAEPFFENTGLFDVADEQILRKEARVIAIDLACQFAVTKCLNETHNQLKSLFIQNGYQLPLNTRAIIFRNGIRNATDEELEALWNRFVGLKDESLRAIIVTSFGYIGRRDALYKYLLRTLDESSNLTIKERWTIFSSANRNGGLHGLSACIQILKGHLSVAAIQYKIYDLNTIVADLASNIYTRHIQTEVQIGII